MTQFELLVDTLTKNQVNFHTSDIYDEQHNKHKSIWFPVGHIEFDDNENVKNVVNW